jgi:nitrous oxidase accessory protein NosD
VFYRHVRGNDNRLPLQQEINIFLITPLYLSNEQVGNGALNIEESRTHFSLWAAMKAPLILGNDLTHMSETIYDILTNQKVISVNVS